MNKSREQDVRKYLVVSMCLISTLIQSDKHMHECYALLVAIQGNRCVQYTRVMLLALSLILPRHGVYSKPYLEVLQRMLLYVASAGHV